MLGLSADSFFESLILHKGDFHTIRVRRLRPWSIKDVVLSMDAFFECPRLGNRDLMHSGASSEALERFRCFDE